MTGSKSDKLCAKRCASSPEDVVLVKITAQKFFRVRNIDPGEVLRARSIYSVKK